MTQQQRDDLDAALRRAQTSTQENVEQRRRRMNAMMMRPVPTGTLTRRDTLNAVPVHWAQAPWAHPDRVVLYFHGGGYVVGSAEAGLALAAQVALRIGGRAASVDYRLAPEHPAPAAVRDALDAYRGLLDTGVPPDQVVIAGESAGGGIALALLVAARDAGLPAPAAAFVMSPWADLTLSGESMRTLAGVDPLFTRVALEYYAELYAEPEQRGDPLVSPVFADLHGLPPLLIQVGAHEVLLDDATRLAAQAGAADVRVELQVWPGVPHVFQGAGARLDDAAQALDQAGRFLRSHLARVDATTLPEVKDPIATQARLVISTDYCDTLSASRVG